MIHFVGLDVSQKMTAICAVDNAGRRLWRGQCLTVPEQIHRVCWGEGEPIVIPEQDWLTYTFSMIAFCAGCFFLLYAVQRLQNFFPLNPQGLGSVPPALASNTAISFITNANWQAYAGETTMSHFTQMVRLTANNFLDSAVATAVAIVVVRAFARSGSPTIGNLL